MNDLEVITTPVPFEEPKVLVKMQDIFNLWDLFVKMRGKLMPTTQADYKYIGKRFCNFASGRPIGPQLLQDWMQYIQSWQTHRVRGNRPLSTVKVNQINIRIRSFLSWLHRFGYLTHDHAPALPRLQEPLRKQAQIFTEAEYNQIKAYCSGRLWCQPHLWLLILAYRTGLTMKDACYLRWRGVHLNHNSPSFIDIYRIKTERFGEKALCQIPIVPHTDVHKWLVMLKKAEPANYKRFDGITDFVHQDCPGLYECRFQTIFDDFKNIFKRAGVGNERTFRNMRNTFISNLVNSDVQMGLIMKMTGHQNAATLLRYLKADRRALQDGVVKAQRYAASQAGAGLDPAGIAVGNHPSITGEPDLYDNDQSKDAASLPKNTDASAAPAGHGGATADAAGPASG